MNVLKNLSFDNGSPQSVSAQRGQAPAVVWKLTAMVLLFPVYMWLVCILLTPSTAVEFAEHMATYGEHYEPYGYHVPPAVEKPQAAGSVDLQTAGLVLAFSCREKPQREHGSRDRPPPLFNSNSHSLRAPPTLIPA
jgi:hypothetical protein